MKRSEPREGDRLVSLTEDLWVFWRIRYSCGYGKKQELGASMDNNQELHRLHVDLSYYSMNTISL